VATGKPAVRVGMNVGMLCMSGSRVSVYLRDLWSLPEMAVALIVFSDAWSSKS
jgi:hypothetical protein